MAHGVMPKLQPFGCWYHVPLSFAANTECKAIEIAFHMAQFMCLAH